MRAPGWFSCGLADVPADDGWLSDAEHAVLARLRVPKRRRDWRLGRFTAKAAIAAFADVPPRRIEVLAGPNGAPEARIGGSPATVSLSLSHRAGRGLAVVCDAASAIGCDLEVIEPRSGAFVAEWLAPAEQARLAAACAEDRALLANLAWSAKEAAAKARRQGLRLDVRNAVTHVVGRDPAQGWREPARGARTRDERGWEPLTVNWAGARSSTAGWWRHEPGWVIAIAGEPAPMLPFRLSAREPKNDPLKRSR
jgi:4'-phosphopantetheinyl transferase